MVLWVEPPHPQSPLCHVGDHVTCSRGDVTSKIVHVTSQKCVVRGSCDSMEGFCHNKLPAKSGGHRPSITGDIMFSIWHVTSCDHVIKESHGLILGFLSPHVSTLATVADHTSSGERNILFLVRHVTLVWLAIDFLGAFTYKQFNFEKIARLFSRANFPAQDELFV